MPPDPTIADRNAGGSRRRNSIHLTASASSLDCASIDYDNVSTATQPQPERIAPSDNDEQQHVNNIQQSRLSLHASITCTLYPATATVLNPTITYHDSDVYRAIPKVEVNL